jgi:hypothetical protein
LCEEKFQFAAISANKTPANGKLTQGYDFARPKFAGSLQFAANWVSLQTFCKLKSGVIHGISSS